MQKRSEAVKSFFPFFSFSNGLGDKIKIQSRLMLNDNKWNLSNWLLFVIMCSRMGWYLKKLKRKSERELFKMKIWTFFFWMDFHFTSFLQY